MKTIHAKIALFIAIFTFMALPKAKAQGPLDFSLVGIKKIVEVTVPNANIRDTPRSTANNKVRMVYEPNKPVTIEKGTHLAVVAENPQWYQVYYPQMDRPVNNILASKRGDHFFKAWIAKSVVKEVEACPAAELVGNNFVWSVSDQEDGPRNVTIQQIKTGKYAGKLLFYGTKSDEGKTQYFIGMGMMMNGVVCMVYEEDFAKLVHSRAVSGIKVDEKVIDEYNAIIEKTLYYGDQFAGRNGHFAFEKLTTSALEELLGAFACIEPIAKKDIQGNNAQQNTTQSTEVCNDFDEAAEFPGGKYALNGFIAQNLIYPEVSAKKGVQGRVIVQFIVQVDGSVTNAKVIRSVEPNLDREAIRVVNAMPKWKPAMKNGKPCASQMAVPVSFRLM